ncbi:DUF58 domain-containing protein [Rossellomorea sp. SC111]|uniref:DUF58 domain-containing protein n=1 Tax=Rossellomorea sp. SC111 TaxID=2968985 RepID=UPI00215A5D4B|nr:DUF58 domain-containing protein [Rossellomorea sp. SC111]MCR8849162.1 DUF58 domain-containing protein [Rossellomorea sp. SC111]
MDWKREVIEDPYNSLSEVLLIIAIGVSFFVQSYIGLAIFLLCFLYFRVHKWYLEKIGDGIKIIKKTKRVRLHCDEEGYWDFQVENHGLPVWGASLKLSFRDIVEPTSHPYESYHGNIVEVSVPFSLKKDEKGLVRLPIKGKRRGLCRLTKVQLVIPHLFGSGKVIMDLQEPVPSTMIVFPSPSSVKVFKNRDSNRNGELSSPRSLFFDVFQPIGTREYASGDRFQDIHWKASARTGQLQTKVFAPSTKKEWMIAINLTDRYAITGQLESIIKHTAYLMHLAVEQNISFSLVLNARSQGATPFYYLPSGTGRAHQQKGLELLATLSTDDFTVPFLIVLQHLYIRQLVPHVFIVSGIMNSKEKERLVKISMKQSEIFMLNSDEEQGVVTVWNQILKMPS